MIAKCSPSEDHNSVRITKWPCTFESSNVTRKLIQRLFESLVVMSVKKIGGYTSCRGLPNKRKGPKLTESVNQLLCPLSEAFDCIDVVTHMTWAPVVIVALWNGEICWGNWLPREQWTETIGESELPFEKQHPPNRQRDDEFVPTETDLRTDCPAFHLGSTGGDWFIFFACDGVSV